MNQSESGFENGRISEILVRDSHGSVSLYHAANVPHVAEVPTHDGLVVIWCEERQLVQLGSSPSGIVFHV